MKTFVCAHKQIKPFLAVLHKCEFFVCFSCDIFSAILKYRLTLAIIFRGLSSSPKAIPSYCDCRCPMAMKIISATHRANATSRQFLRHYCDVLGFTLYAGFIVIAPRREEHEPKSKKRRKPRKERYILIYDWIHRLRCFT